MHVRLVKEKVIQDFVAKHAIGKSAFRTWLDVLKSADWTMPEDMKGTFPATDILGKGCKRAVFDIGGNKYRLICGYLFGIKEVHLFICWIGTHAEYTKLCDKGDQYTVSMFK
jgi:mRNA interferase HigB